MKSGIPLLDGLDIPASDERAADDALLFVFAVTSSSESAATFLRFPLVKLIKGSSSSSLCMSASIGSLVGGVLFRPARSLATEDDFALAKEEVDGKPFIESIKGLPDGFTGVEKDPVDRRFALLLGPSSIELLVWGVKVGFESLDCKGVAGGFDSQPMRLFCFIPPFVPCGFAGAMIFEGIDHVRVVVKCSREGCRTELQMTRRVIWLVCSRRRVAAFQFQIIWITSFSTAIDDFIFEKQIFTSYKESLGSCKLRVWDRLSCEYLRDPINIHTSGP